MQLAGRTVSANSGTMPALIGQGVSMTLGFLGMMLRHALHAALKR